MNHLGSYAFFDDAMDDGDDVWAEAALLFLNDNDDDIMTDSASVSSLLPPPIKTEQDDTPLDLLSSSLPPGKPRRVNRRREEILFLREQAHQLEDRLLATRQRMEEGVALDRDLEPMERELLAAAWSTIAAQQRDQREQSEAEHDRLLQLLDEQRLLAKSLQRYARRHAVHEIPAPLQVYAPLHMPLSDTQALIMPACFDELERALESMYDQRNAVFSDARFDDVLTTLRASRIINANSSRAGIEVLDARVLPFNVETTANALWQSMVHRVPASVAYDSDNFDPHHDVIKKSFFAALDLPMFQTSVRAHLVVKRMVEPHRVVILRATHFEPIGLTDSGIDPFTVRHYQWNTVELPHHARFRSSRFATAQIQSFNLSFPSLASDCDPSASHANDTILEFCETAIAYHLDLARQSVENFLVSGGSMGATLGNDAAPPRSGAAMKLEAC